MMKKNQRSFLTVEIFHLPWDNKDIASLLLFRELCSNDLWYFCYLKIDDHKFRTDKAFQKHNESSTNDWLITHYFLQKDLICQVFNDESCVDKLTEFLLAYTANYHVTGTITEITMSFIDMSNHLVVWWKSGATISTYRRFRLTWYLRWNVFNHMFHYFGVGAHCGRA